MRRWLAAVALLVLFLVSAPRAQAAATYTLPATIDGTGTLDVTNQLNGFLASVPDGSTVVFPERRRFRVEGTIQLTGRAALTILGNQSETFATSRGAPDRAHWAVRESTNITIKQLRVQGVNRAGDWQASYTPAVEWQHGFKLAGVRGVVLEEVSVADVYGEFVYVGSSNNTLWSRDVKVLRSTFERAGRQGIAVVAGDGVLVEGNSLSHVANFVFDVEPNHGREGARNLRFVRNSIGPSKYFFSAAGAKAPTEGIELTGNVLRGTPLNVVVDVRDGGRASTLAVRQNSTDTPFGLGPLIRLLRVDNAVVEDNTAPFDPAKNQTAIVATDTCGLHIGNNRFPGSAVVLAQSPFPCAGSTPTRSATNATPVVQGKPGSAPIASEVSATGQPTAAQGAPVETRSPADSIAPRASSPHAQASPAPQGIVERESNGPLIAAIAMLLAVSAAVLRLSRADQRRRMLGYQQRLPRRLEQLLAAE